MFFGLDSSADYYLYQRGPEDSTGGCNHIVTEGESVCHCNVEVPKSASPTPLESFSIEEWDSLLNGRSNLCSKCKNRMVRAELVPNEFLDESPEDEIPDNEVQPPVEGYHIYYRKVAGMNLSPRDHIVKGDEALCNYGVDVSKAESLKPIENVSIAEWSLLLGQSSNLCGQCLQKAEWDGIFPEEIPDEEPTYQCPVCEEPAEEVDLDHVAYVSHGSTTPFRATIHKAPREHYEQWRRNPV